MFNLPKEDIKDSLASLNANVFNTKAARQRVLRKLLALMVFIEPTVTFGRSTKDATIPANRVVAAKASKENKS